jgi:hypothetical protein
MNSYNRGEWSELFVFLKLLAEGRLYAADENLNRIPDIFYPVLKILRRESQNENWEYTRNGDIQILNASTGETIPVPIEAFINYSSVLFNAIKHSRGYSFYVEEISDFLNTIRVTKIKSPSRNKRDITLIVHDLVTGMTPELGFSIKSQLGGASTLFNSSGSSNFIYRVIGPAFTLAEINQINAIDTRSKVRDRLTAIYDLGRRLEFEAVQGDTLQANLELVDSLMPNIVAVMLLFYYSKEATTVSNILSKLDEQNPLQFRNTATHPMYRYKVKNLLTDMALGMTSYAIWKGVYDATGGYIIVSPTGEVLCYHIYNRNEFQEYLVNNTYFDTPSTSKHGFGKVYETDGVQYFNLNLQIRFT